MPSLTTEQSNRMKKRAAVLSVALTVFLIVIKSIGVLLTGSLSILSSTIDSLSDLFASSITYLAIRYSSEPADCSHRYGHGKAEALSALIQAAFIAGSGIFIFYDGIHRLFSPRPLNETGIGIFIMIVSLIMTILLILYQKYVAARTHSKAISADSAHYTVDVMTNLSIILTLIVVNIFDINWFDTIIAVIISIYLLINAWKLAQDAMATLMDKELNPEIRENIRKIVMSCANVYGLHDLRTRDLGGAYFFELHLELDGSLPLSTTHQYSDEVEKQLQKAYPNAQIIIHQDPAGLKEDRLDHRLQGQCEI